MLRGGAQTPTISTRWIKFRSNGALFWASEGFKKTKQQKHVKKRPATWSKKAPKSTPKGPPNRHKNADRKKTDAQCCKDAPKAMEVSPQVYKIRDIQFIFTVYPAHRPFRFEKTPWTQIRPDTTLKGVKKRAENCTKTHQKTATQIV